MGGSRFDGVDDLDITRAAAQVIVDGLSDVVAAGLLVLHQEGVAAQQHAGDAVAALHGGLVEEGLLDGMEGVVLAQSFDGEDVFAGGVFELPAAGAHGLVVDENDAGAAYADVTAIFRACQIEVFAQKFEQCFVLASIVDDVFCSVYRDFHGVFLA